MRELEVRFLPGFLLMFCVGVAVRPNLKIWMCCDPAAKMHSGLLVLAVHSPLSAQSQQWESKSRRSRGALLGPLPYDNVTFPKILQGK